MYVHTYSKSKNIRPHHQSPTLSRSILTSSTHADESRAESFNHVTDELSLRSATPTPALRTLVYKVVQLYNHTQTIRIDQSYRSIYYYPIKPYNSSVQGIKKTHNHLIICIIKSVTYYVYQFRSTRHKTAPSGRSSIVKFHPQYILTAGI